MCQVRRCIQERLQPGMHEPRICAMSGQTGEIKVAILSALRTWWNSVQTGQNRHHRCRPTVRKSQLRRKQNAVQSDHELEPICQLRQIC